MNWPKIRTGTLLAAVVLWVLDLVTVGALHLLAHNPMGGWAADLRMAAGYLILPDLAVGFFLCWLYVLARPRLGPGPKTALIMGSIAFVLSNQQLLNILLWIHSPGGAALQVVITWVKFVAATYVAGWQYIERAP